MQTPSRISDRLPALAGRLLLLTFIAAVPLAGSAYAESLTLAWDANTESNVAGYNVYRSQQSGVFGSTPRNGSTLITGTTYTDSGVQAGSTYYYVVTAVSTTGEESSPSAQVQAVIPSQITNSAPTVNLAPSQTITLPQTATLTASASDDGKPNGTLSYQWSTVSGAGVTFSSPTAATTQAAFTAAGTYTLRVTVSDGQLSAFADTTVSVNAEPEEDTESETNKAPSISAIPSQTITLPQTATLSASASDDGKPNGTLSYQWSTVSGAGVTFSSPTAATTQAAFTAAGTYTLRVTVSDGQLSAFADATVSVNAEPETNKAPSISAIPTQTITLPQAATLTASASDDGKPNKTLSYQWGKISGAEVSFSTTSAATTQVAFASAGTYTLRVTVSDGQLSAFADATVYVIAEPGKNLAPSISAIPSQTVTLSQTATLTANATDDGLPNGTLSYQWSKASGAGVFFTSPSAATTGATFTSAGTYTLRVVVSDGGLSASGYATVYVTSDPDANSTSDGTKRKSGGGNKTTTDDAPDAPTTVEAEVTTEESRPGPPTNLRRSEK